MSATTTLHTKIDFDKDGHQAGFLNLPFSPHTDAWGVVPIPMAVLKNGTGPTVLLVGGIHGDEYEGPIVMGEIIRDWDPKMIEGRLIVLPALNLPAVLAGNRMSPLDDKNMNRCFPGDPSSSPTYQITHYLDSVIMPMCDAFLDLHSGGSSLDVATSCMVYCPSDPDLNAKTMAANIAFNAPLTVVNRHPSDNGGGSLNSSRKRGLISVGTEMGRAGSVSIDDVAVCRNGVRNVLAHLGVIDQSEAGDKTSIKTRLVHIPGQDGHHYAPENGVFEPFHALYSAVEAGQPAGRVHFLDDPRKEPVLVRYQVSGILFCRRAPGLVVRGNNIAIVVQDE
ncbi:succinylglutamate desuccinylase/aspartoacylase family protein [Devosia algicola]|uniref:Succinylglutamate desuccinylase/aspartoacylase family protein n=1 Tax=Devosia algicola TaxID=3026418 RepID=A0ABY7YJ71_9HYPH|nr:succinylglutamate desuccinylase/aspartoacylase family protein [Devosia algicola]WDR01319.1 succinylglutamate desuccinylase/aspartoacylase family protein [Devosia algicola]